MRKTLSRKELARVRATSHIGMYPLKTVKMSLPSKCDNMTLLIKSDKKGVEKLITDVDLKKSIDKDR